MTGVSAAPRPATCGWCNEPMGTISVPPIRVHGKSFHTSCVRAYAADFVDRAAR